MFNNSFSKQNSEIFNTSENKSGRCEINCTKRNELSKLSSADDDQFSRKET